MGPRIKLDPQPLWGPSDCRAGRVLAAVPSARHRGRSGSAMPRPRAAEAAFIGRNGASPLQRKALRHGAPPSCSARRQQDPPAGARDATRGDAQLRPHVRRGRSLGPDSRPRRSSAPGPPLGALGRAARPQERACGGSRCPTCAARRARPPCCPHRPRPRAVAQGRTRRGPDAAPSRWQLRARLRSRHCRWFRLRQARARWRLLATPGPRLRGTRSGAPRTAAAHAMGLSGFRRGRPARVPAASARGGDRVPGRREAPGRARQPLAASAPQGASPAGAGVASASGPTSWGQLQQTR